MVVRCDGYVTVGVNDDDDVDGRRMSMTTTGTKDEESVRYGDEGTVRDRVRRDRTMTDGYGSRRVRTVTGGCQFTGMYDGSVAGVRV